MGYYTDGDFGTITYSSTPATATIQAAPTGCPAGTSTNAATFEGKPVCNLPVGSPITTDMHLTANNSYFMNGTVFVGENDLNTGCEGQADNRSCTKIISEGGQSALVINRGGKIFANGSAAETDHHEHPVRTTEHWMY